MKKKRSSIYKILKGIGIALLAVILLFVLELYISANWLKVNVYNFESDKVDTPVKVMILSDLHDHDFKGALERKIRREEPDVIIMAGDMINSDTDKQQQLYDLIKELSKVAPIYYGLGNHEDGYIKNINSSFIEEIESYGCQVLDYDYVDLNINNNNIRIGGLYDYPYALGACLAEDATDEIKTFMNDFVNTDHLKLMIAHRPESYVYGNSSEVYNIDMVISGHIHAGQVIIPFKGGLYGGDQGWFPKYYHGLYKKNNINWIITSGLGTSKKKFPRFNNRPEIMILKIN